MERCDCEVRCKIIEIEECEIAHPCRAPVGDVVSIDGLLRARRWMRMQLGDRGSCDE